MANVALKGKHKYSVLCFKKINKKHLSQISALQFSHFSLRGHLPLLYLYIALYSLPWYLAQTMMRIYMTM